MKKRLVALLLTAAMSIGAFTGCAPAAKETPAETKTESQAKDETKPAETKAEEPTEEAKEEPAAAPADDAEGKVLRIAITTEPPNLDQQVSTDQVSGEIMGATYEGLVRNYGGKVNPGMAEKWEISPDGLVYTFHLRDAKWSDGKPVTSKDFEYAFKRLLDPATACEYAFQGYYIKGAEAFNTGKGTADQVGVKAIDDKTFEVTLEIPTTYFLSLMGFGTFFPARQDIIEQHKESYATDADKAVYNGPFLLQEWQHETSVTLVKNPDYWNAAAIKLDKVESPIIVDAKTVINLYEEGSLDYAGLGKDFVQKYKDEGTAQYYYDGAVMYFQFNQKNTDPAKTKLLQNKDFRLALGYALDRKTYIDAVLKNNSDPANRYNLAQMAGPTPDKTFAEQYPIEFYPPNADLVKSKEHLDKAAKDLGIAVDALPSIEYLTDDSEDVRIQAEAIQSMVKQVGIKFEIKQVPFKERLQLMEDGNYDIVGALWGPDYNDVMTNLDIWTSNSALNSAKWENAEYDKNIFAAKKEPDAMKRGQMLADAEKILLEEAVIVPIYFRKRAYVMQPYLKGMELNFVGVSRNWVYADIVK